MFNTMPTVMDDPQSISAAAGGSLARNQTSPSDIALTPPTDSPSNSQQASPKASASFIYPSPNSADVSASVQRLRTFSPNNPLRVVIIHGDPNKPNDILPGGKWDEDDFYTIEKAKEALDTLASFKFTWLCNHDTLMDDLRRMKAQDQVDLVLQLCDEGWMNNSRMELHVTAFLEMLEIPYTGAGPKTIGVTYDKQAVVKIAESIGVPVPRSVFLADDSQLDPTSFGLEYPIIVKPNSTDGSFGITSKSVCHNLNDVKEAIKMIRETFQIQGAVLFQEYLTGRDVNVGVMERPTSSGKMEPWTLPITEEDYSALPANLPKICGFESKWDESSPYYQIKTRPTTVSPEVQAKLGEWSCRVFKRIECRDYARFDWRLDAKGNPRLLEANPNCGWCWDGHLPKTAGLAGISYPQFFETILKSAVSRALAKYEEKEALKNKKFIQVGRNGAEGLYSGAIPQ